MHFNAVQMYINMLDLTDRMLDVLPDERIPDYSMSKKSSLIFIVYYLYKKTSLTLKSSLLSTCSRVADVMR